MKKIVFITLTTMFLTGQNPVCVFSQEVETVQTETSELSEKERKKLQKQQEKEQKKLKKQQEKEEKELRKKQEKEEKNTEAQNDIVNDTEHIENHVSSQSETNEFVDREINTTTQNKQESSDYLYTPNQEQEKTAKKEPKSSRPLSSQAKLVIWAIVFGVLFIWIIIHRFNRKCDKCKKWNAMKKTGTECVDEKPTTIVEKRERKNRNGQVISSWEVDVPATIYYYRTHRKCKHCGYRDYLTSSETAKN